jgi:hypothetical protein
VISRIDFYRLNAKQSSALRGPEQIRFARRALCFFIASPERGGAETNVEAEG